MDKKILNLLILEDNPDDAGLIVKELKKEGFIVKWSRIDTEKAFKKSLANKPDLILADYRLPKFDGMSVLKLQQKLTPDIPLIIVSGTIGEDIAVGCMKAGATDYVLKDKLSRLGPIVRRALKESEEHKERKRTEEKLLANEKQYQKIFNSTTDSFLIFDMKGNIVEANHQACKMYGYPYKELIKLSGKDIVHPDYYHLFKNFKRDVRTTGEFYSESVDVHKDGTYFDIEVKGTKLDYKGKPHLLAIVRDITQRKKVEETLRKSEERNRLITENTSDIIILTTFELNPVFKYISPSIKIIGYEPEDLLGKPCLDFISSNDKKELIPLLKGYLSKKAKNIIFGKDQVISERIEFHFKDKHGGWRFAQSTVNIIGDQILFVSRDITEHKTAENALRESEKRFQQVAENSLDWIWEVDANGLYTYASPVVEKILGYKPEEIVGKKHFYDLFHPDDREKLKKVAFQVFAKKQSFREFINWNVNKNKGTVWLSTSGVPILDKEGNLTGYRGADTDITERKKAQETIEESEYKYRTIFEQAVDSIVIIEPSTGKFIDFNDSAYKNLGYTKEEFKNLKLSDFEVIESDKEILERMDKIIKSGSDYFETKHKTKSGDIRNIIVNVKLITIHGIKYVHAIWKDITEYKKAEEQIRQLQEYLQLQIERMPIGLIVWDKEFHVKSWNPSAERIFGFTAIEVQGKHPYGLIVPKEGQSHVDNIWRRLLEGDTTAHSTNENITKNGSTIICDWINTPLKRVDGSVMGVLSMVQDITERKKAEEIQTTIYNISNAVNTAKDLDEFFEIIHTQLSKIIDTTNFYIALYEKESDTISLPYHVDRRDRFKIFPAGKTLTSYVIKKGKSLLATEKVFNKLEKIGEVELIGKPSKIWLGVPLKVEDEVIGVVAVQSYTDDITYSEEDMKILEFVSDQVAIAIDRKKKGEQIKKDLEEKIVMLMEIHHRVKNNMQVISSMLKMQSAYIRDEQDRELFKDSLTRVKSMALIHEKLYQTKDLASIDFNEYVKSLAMHLFSTFGVYTNIVRLSTNIKDVFLDINTAIPCGLIINELISNSLKYAFLEGKEGVITIDLVGKKSTENKKEKIYTLVVSDNGVGFPADVDFRNTESLGLQLVNTLVDQLHGDIKLDRRGGTSFKIVFKRSEMKKRSKFY